jgi:hypothetical protein
MTGSCSADSTSISMVQILTCQHPSWLQHMTRMLQRRTQRTPMQQPQARSAVAAAAASMARRRLSSCLHGWILDLQETRRLQQHQAVGTAARVALQAGLLQAADPPSTVAGVVKMAMIHSHPLLMQMCCQCRQGSSP